MAGLTPESSEQIVGTCRKNLQEISQSLNTALGVKYQLSFETPPIAGGPALVDRAHDEPGLMLLFQVGEQAVACLVPESLPVPNWYRSPNDSQKAGLQTLAMEWATSMLPLEMETTQFAAVACGSLKRQLMACGIDETTQLMEIGVQSPLVSAHLPKFQMFWPLNTPRFQAVGDWPAIPVVEDQVEEAEDFVEDAPVARTSDELRRRRVLGIPVPLVVRIAEKRIDLRQLRQLAPGMLLTFDKPCEDPLDVYIGQQLYCRGEAVKMGEHFAIKINETGSRNEREPRVHRI